jgi:predicted transcriptional regulator
MRTDKKMIIIPDFLIVLKQLASKPDQSVTSVQLGTTITYSHLHNMKKVLVTKKLITMSKKGVKNILNLTPKGKEVVDKAFELFTLLGITESNISEYRRRGKIKYNKQVEEPAEDLEKELREEIEEEEKMEEVNNGE